MSQSWDHVQNLFLQALDLRPEERAAFLETACAGNAEVRREVESLLAHDGASEKRIADALEGTAHSLFESVNVQPGTKLGDYEVQKLIGSGGMGEVYQARDVRLARDVAIKVLPPLLRYQPDRLRRFEQEARAAAALNHPNILAVYQLGIYEGAPYLVSELLEGATLRELMKRGPLPSRTAIDYGVQIARGLAAAHDKGITHRDLKPENLFITKDGRLRILDFGLAKLTQAPSSYEPGQAATEAGLVMGTVGYMSPEQVRGEPADSRADIFSFGAVLYEMLCGQRAFQAPTAAETMSAILNQDPPGISQLLPATPPGLQRVVHRCLEKNREQRFQSASDLAFALEALSDPSISGDKVASEKKTSIGRRGVMLTIGACAIVLLVAYLLRPAMPLPRVSRIVQLTRSGGARNQEPLFTDGPRVYYQAVGPAPADWQFRQVLLNGNEDTSTGVPAGRFSIHGLSPDDTEFLATGLNSEQRKVWTIPVTTGGSPRRVGNLFADDIAWSHDGAWFAYSQGNQLFLAKSDGTSARALAAVAASGRIDHVRWSPDDRLLRFTLISETTRALWEIGVDGRNLHELRFNWPGDATECCGEWTPDGRYFMFSSRREGISNLWMLQEKSDWWRRALRDPIQLTSGPVNYYQPTPSGNGKSVFAVGVQPSGELVRYDAGRKDFLPFLGGRSIAHLTFTRDGKWVAYVDYPEATLWRAHSDGTEPLQLTYPPLQVAVSHWSADGKRIAFHAIQPGQLWKDFVISAEGGNPEPFPPEPLTQATPDWMPSGDALIYSRTWEAKNPELRLFDLRSGRSEKIPGTEGLYDPIWSPDGRYLAVVDANASDHLLLVDLKSGKRTQVAGPARWPAWSPDSQYLYFIRDRVKWILRVRVPDGQEEEVLEVPFRLTPWPFTVAPDGSLIMLREHGRYDVYSLALSFP
jgi:serine/threonine protein kinase/Tol biopolymer transport system component